MNVPDQNVVRLPRSPDLPLAEAMREFRAWLDANKIELMLYRSVSRKGWQGYEFFFNNAGDAELFREKFAQT